MSLSTSLFDYTNEVLLHIRREIFPIRIVSNVSQLRSVLSMGLSCCDWCWGWSGPRDVAQAVSLAAAGQPSLGYLTMPTIDNYKTTGQDTWTWWPAWQHTRSTWLHAMTSLASFWCCTRCYNPLMNVASCFISFNTSISRSYSSVLIWSLPLLQNKMFIWLSVSMLSTHYNSYCNSSVMWSKAE